MKMINEKAGVRQMTEIQTGAEFDGNYKKWISEVSNRFKASQIKASIKVNDEMLRFYWVLGRDIEMMKANATWGSHIYQKISQDLVEELPEIKSFSPRNLQYMNQFYRLYSNVEITHQLDAQIFKNEITHQVGAQINKNIIFMIPWGHHKVIMDKCKDDQQKALFFVQKTLENSWSRAVLLNFLDTKLFDRQGKAVTNQIFILTLNAYFHREISYNQVSRYESDSFFMIRKVDNISTVECCENKPKSLFDDPSNRNPVQNSYAALWEEYCRRLQSGRGLYRCRTV